MTARKNRIITAERAREILRYDPESGKLFWRANAGRWGQIPAGVEAGCVSIYGYWQVWIDGHLCLGHRLIWLIVTGIWPAEEIDHIDGDRLNNRWNNLREVSSIENKRNAKQYTNNTSGVTGVFWHKARRKWQAQIRVNGTRVHLGYFDDLAAAAKARKAAERRYGFHENHGRIAP